jgi:hypothetical protein
MVDCERACGTCEVGELAVADRTAERDIAHVHKALLINLSVYPLTLRRLKTALLKRQRWKLSIARSKAQKQAQKGECERCEARDEARDELAPHRGDLSHKGVMIKAHERLKMGSHSSFIYSFSLNLMSSLMSSLILRESVSESVSEGLNLINVS